MSRSIWFNCLLDWNQLSWNGPFILAEGAGRCPVQGTVKVKNVGKARNPMKQAAAKNVPITEQGAEDRMDRARSGVILEMRGIEKSFGPVKALRDVNLS